MKNGTVIVKGALSSASLELSAIENVHFTRFRGVLYRLTLSEKGGREVVANGVSTRRRAFLNISPDETRDEMRARQRVQAFFKETQVEYEPPSL